MNRFSYAVLPYIQKYRSSLFLQILVTEFYLFLFIIIKIFNKQYGMMMTH